MSVRINGRKLLSKRDLGLWWHSPLMAFSAGGVGAAIALQMWPALVIAGLGVLINFGCMVSLWPGDPKDDLRIGGR